MKAIIFHEQGGIDKLRYEEALFHPLAHQKHWSKSRRVQ